MNKNAPPTSRQGLGPANTLTLVQHNSLGSWDVFLCLFSSLMECPLVDIVLSQDPAFLKGFLPGFSGFKCFAPLVLRPKVAWYISQKFLRSFSVLPVFSPDLQDFMALEVYTPKGCLGSIFPRFTIGNAYARRIDPPSPSVLPEISFVNCDFPYLVADDFNIRNLAVDPSRVLSSSEEKELAPFFDLAPDLGFSLLNIPGT